VYAGTRITLADGGMSHGDQVQVLRRYRGGASVQVFYDPRDPGKAVLEPRAVLWAPTWWIGGLSLGGGALMLIIRLWQRLAGTG